MFYLECLVRSQPYSSPLFRVPPLQYIVKRTRLTLFWELSTPIILTFVRLQVACLVQEASGRKTNVCRYGCSRLWVLPFPLQCYCRLASNRMEVYRGGDSQPRTHRHPWRSTGVRNNEPCYLPSKLHPQAFGGAENSSPKTNNSHDLCQLH